MKKIYLLSLLCCLSIAAFAGSTTMAPMYSTGAAGSFVTGSSTTTTRTDGSIICTTVGGTQESGYAVFDLSTVPAGVQIETVTLGFDVATFGGSGPVAGCSITGFSGSLTGVSAPATLFGDMFGGTGLSGTAFGAFAGNQTVVLSGPAAPFFTANIGGNVSICWNGGGTRIFTITGETGTPTTSGTHAPYIIITYCGAPKAVTATASPIPVCENTILNLNGTATMPLGAAAYLWTGPTGSIPGGLSTAITAAYPGSAGVYTLTAVNVCSTINYSVTATTAPVSVNPAPSPIIGSNAVCLSPSVGSTIALSDATPSGTWSSSFAPIASVDAFGNVTGNSSGTVAISYKFPTTGCYAVQAVTVNAPPGVISGPTKVCQGSLVTLAVGSGIGAWSSSSVPDAPVDAFGDVTGITGGLYTISYSVPGCVPVTYPMTVNDTPTSIIAPTAAMCTSNSISFSDATPLGTWSATGGSGFISAGPGPGAGTFITTFTAGVENITYTISSTGCFVVTTVSVNPAPKTPTGPFPLQVCQGQTIVLSDITTGGNWSTASSTLALVNFSTGGVTGLAGGNPKITYSTGVGCDTTITVKVIAAPAAIVGPTTICQSDSFLLSDASLGSWSTTTSAVGSIGTASGKVKTTGFGTFTAIYTDRGTSCYDSLNISVNPSPSPVVTPSGATTFCSGGSVTLSVTAGLGYIYQWYDAGTPITGATNSSYTTSVTQALSVTIDNSFSCKTTTATTLIISGISPIIDSSGPLHFCLGNNVVLTANTNGAVGSITYQWQKNGADITSATTVSYVAASAGKYTCVVTVSGGSSSCSATTTVDSVYTNTPPAPSINYSGSKFSTESTYVGYQWFLNALGIPGAVSATFTPVKNGSYRVLVTDANGCSGYSSPIQLGSVGVQQIGDNTIKMYPNPASAMLHIESQATVRAIITSMEGRTVLDQSNATDINISNLANGLYMVMLFDENGQRVMVEKLVKE